MHSRNIYKDGIDFYAIYKESQPSRDFLYLNSEGNVKMIESRESQKFLTDYLLRLWNFIVLAGCVNCSDFALEIEFSPLFGRLCGRDCALRRLDLDLY